MISNVGELTFAG